jgi:hypothetical protein
MLGSGRAALEGEATTLSDLRRLHVDDLRRIGPDIRIIGTPFPSRRPGPGTPYPFRRPGPGTPYPFRRPGPGTPAESVEEDA